MQFLVPFAQLTAAALELVGILIIFVGSVRALIRLLRSLKNKQSLHIVSELGRALSLALEFKMGAEIIKTVIIHDLEELAILGVVVVIRALLAILIHWEMHAEEKTQQS